MTFIRMVAGVEEVYQQRIREKTKANKKRRKGNITRETKIRAYRSPIKFRGDLPVADKT